MHENLLRLAASLVYVVVAFGALDVWIYFSVERNRRQFKRWLRDFIEEWVG